MAKFLIAVGGTGQEIALSCLRLCHMAGDGVELPWVYVLDSDIGEGDTEPQKTRFKVLAEIERYTSEYREQPSQLRNPAIFRKTDAADNPAAINYVDDLFKEETLSDEVISAFDLFLTKNQRETL